MAQLAENNALEYRERRKLRKAALREEIMNAAAELFAVEGYGSV